MANDILTINGQEITAGDTNDSVLTISNSVMPVELLKALGGVYNLYIQIPSDNSGTFKFNMGAETDDPDTSASYAAGDKILIIKYNNADLHWKQSSGSDVMNVTIAL